MSPMSRTMISVQTVVQGTAAAGAGVDTARCAVVRQQHRVAAGTTIRALLELAGRHDAVAGIESRTLGLACHGRRAWLDDILVDGSRVEILEPINADAKAARAERVAADRRRRQVRFGSGG